MEIKKIFTRPKLKVKINEKEYNIVGRLGMYHAIIDITNSQNIDVGTKVALDVPPIYINTEIRREYI